MATRTTIPQEKDVKVCVVGPTGCGKTTITRAMADWNPKTERYAPTAGVRIQEVERKIAKSVHMWAVQLWDCSGDARFQDCWPAMAKDAHGLFLVYNVDASESNQQELERWYKLFALPNKLAVSACHIFGISMSGDNLQCASTSRLEGKLHGISHQIVSIDDGQLQEQLYNALDSILAVIDSKEP